MSLKKKFKFQRNFKKRSPDRSTKVEKEPVTDRYSLTIRVVRKAGSPGVRSKRRNASARGQGEREAKRAFQREGADA